MAAPLAACGANPPSFNEVTLPEAAALRNQRVYLMPGGGQVSALRIAFEPRTAYSTFGRAR